MAVSTLGQFNLLTRTATTPASASTMSAGIGAISAVAGAISSMYASKVSAIGYQMQESARRAQASKAISDAKFSSLKLKRRYNEVGSNQAVMFTAQGRSLSSGSIQNILRVDQENLQWDLDYTKLQGEAGSAAAIADAEGFGTAAKLAKQGGVQKGLLTLAQTALDFKRIK